MEDYKEKLKEALNSDNTDYEVVRWIEQNFPELKESEDEETRKSITEFFKNYSENGTWKAIPDVTKWIAWLEKQGKKKSIDDLTQQEAMDIAVAKCFEQGEQETLCDKCKKEQPSHSCQDITALGRCALEKQGEHRQDTNYPKFDFNDVLSLQCCMETVKKVQEDKDLYEKLKDLHGRIYDAYHFEKQGEQKPAWSEELDALIRKLEGENIYVSPHLAAKCLKSLRTQKQWKPTGEQIEALTDIINLLASSPAPHCKDYFIIKELKEQLKNLV